MSPDVTEPKRSIEVAIASSPFFEIPRDGKGKVRWAALRQNPEQMQRFLEQIAPVYWEPRGTERFDQRSIFGISYATFSHAVRRFYPNGYVDLRDKLSLPESTIPAEVRVSLADSSSSLPRGKNNKIYWKALVDQPDLLKQAMQTLASEHIQRFGSLSVKSLRKHDSGFYKAAYDYYPGQFRQLRRDLGLETSQAGIYRDTKGNIVWPLLKNHPDQLIAVIEAEAKRAIEGGVRLVPREMQKQGHSSLVSAVYRFYPGRLTALRSKLDHLKGIDQKFVWQGQTGQEKVRQEAQAVYQEHGSLTNTLLRRIGRKELLSAIMKNYPGKLSGLQKKLGIASIQKRGYWNKDSVWTEAVAFYKQHGKIGYEYLIAQGRSDLNTAIANHYPGRIAQLKADLGIQNESGSNIPPDEANEQLRRLLEE